MQKQSATKYKNCTGDVLAEELKWRKMLPSELARVSGVSVQLIFQWLNGQVPLADWHIEAVARSLQLDMSYILYGIREATRFN